MIDISKILLLSSTYNKKKYQFPESTDEANLIKTFTFLSIQFSLSLRDIEKCCSTCML